VSDSNHHYSVSNYVTELCFRNLSPVSPSKILAVIYCGIVKETNHFPGEEWLVLLLFRTN
jgi:hypothetical protein